MKKLKLLFIVALLAMTSNAFACTTPAAITGIFILCPPSYTTTLSDATPGGIWSTGDASHVAIDAGTGVVTGISGGTSVVTYTVPGGCFVTVDVTNAAISGPATVCSGSSITLTDAYPGTWSTLSPDILLSGGVVTLPGGYSGGLGSATITYSTLSCSTAITTVVTLDQIPTVTSLNPLPATITYCAWDPTVAFTTTIAAGSPPPFTYNWWWYNPGCSCTSVFATNSGISTDYNTGYRAYGYMSTTDYGTYYGDVVDGLGCVSLLFTGPTLTVNPLPTVYTFRYDDPYVTHDATCTLDLTNSDIGINYTLGVGGVTGTTQAGSGSGLSWSPSLGDGLYYVQATDAATGCTDHMAPDLPVCATCRLAAPALGVGATTATVPLTLLPNPSNGNFTLSGSADFMLDAKTVKAEIMDVAGHLALALDVPVTAGSISQAIQLPGDMVNGEYFVKLSAGTQSQVLRLLLNR